MKIKKILLVLGFLALLLFLGLLVFPFGSSIKLGIERFVPEVILADVSIDSVDLSLLSGSGGVKGVVVGNPKNHPYKTEHLFKVGRIDLDVDMLSLMSDTIVVREVMIDGPEFVYEASIRGSNIKILNQNIAKYLGEGDASEQKSAEGRKVIIEHLVIDHAKLKLSSGLLGGKSITLTVPRIELKGLGADKPLSMADLIKVVFGTVGESMKSLVKNSGKILLSGAKNTGSLVGTGAKKSGQLIQGGVKGAGEVGKNIGKGAQKGVKNLFKGAKGLFKKEN